MSKGANVFARMGTGQVGTAFTPTPMKAIILVGGFGTSMRPLTSDQPKAALNFINKPLLVHHMEALVKIGCMDIVLAMTVKPEGLGPTLKEWM